jgi:hypothetical protein
MTYLNLDIVRLCRQFRDGRYWSRTSDLLLVSPAARRGAVVELASTDNAASGSTEVMRPWRTRPRSRPARRGPLGQCHDQLAVPFEQPLRVDDRQPDDLAGYVEAQHMPIGSLFAVGRDLALSDVQVEQVALLVVARQSFTVESCAPHLLEPAQPSRARARGWSLRCGTPGRLGSHLLSRLDAGDEIHTECV